jgi:hypothetical protein
MTNRDSSKDQSETFSFMEQTNYIPVHTHGTRRRRVIFRGVRLFYGTNVKQKLSLWDQITN